jgi:hypothetical protein
MKTEEAVVIINEAALDDALVLMRRELLGFTAGLFSQVGEELHEVGHIFGPDRASGASPAGHGSDEIVAVSLLLRIAGQLTSASSDLFADGRHYAAAALLRQMVEIEYLAWAFQTGDNEGAKWLRSNAEERRSFFTPAKLRKAANGKFRGEDYGHHCEFGGHPVPGSAVLLQNSQTISQLLVADLLGHTGRIWDHLVGWAASNEWAIPLRSRQKNMLSKYLAWKSADSLASLPSPGTPNGTAQVKR